MRERSVTRRNVLGSGACALAAAAVVPAITSAHARAGLSPGFERIIRSYYAAWENGDWHALDSLLTDGFTFTSPNDNHDSKSVFKSRCWVPNVKLIALGHFDLQLIAGNGDDALVMYVLRMKNGNRIENVEHFHLRDGKVESVRCYFGAQNSYPAAQS